MSSNLQRHELRDCGNLINRIDDKINHQQLLSAVPEEFKSISETVFVSSKEKSNRKKIHESLKNKDSIIKSKKDKDKPIQKVQVSENNLQNGSTVFIQNQEGSQVSVTTTNKKHNDKDSVNESTNQKKSIISSNTKTNSILKKSSIGSRSITNLNTCSFTENENAQSETVYTAKNLDRSYRKHIELDSSISNKQGTNFDKGNATSNFYTNPNMYLGDSEAQKKFANLGTEESGHLLNPNNFISIEETNSFANTVDFSKINFLDEFLVKKMEILKKEICGELEDFVIDRFNNSVITPIFEEIELTKSKINKFSTDCSKNFKEIYRLIGSKNQENKVLADIKDDLKVLKEFINLNKSQLHSDEKPEIFKTMKTVSDVYNIKPIPSQAFRNYKNPYENVNQNLLGQLESNLEINKSYDKKGIFNHQSCR